MSLITSCERTGSTQQIEKQEGKGLAKYKYLEEQHMEDVKTNLQLDNDLIKAAQQRVPCISLHRFSKSGGELLGEFRRETFNTAVPLNVCI